MIYKITYLGLLNDENRVTSSLAEFTQTYISIKYVTVY